MTAVLIKVILLIVLMGSMATLAGMCALIIVDLIKGMLKKDNEDQF